MDALPVVALACARPPGKWSSMMQKIGIPANETLPLDLVAPGLFGLRILFVNVYAVLTDEGWTLIDAGLFSSAGRIVRWAQEHINSSAPNAIVLTHAHFDHVGALDELLEAWKVPVYAHAEELPYVTGARDYPLPDPSVGGGIMARMARLYPRQPVDIGEYVQLLPRDGSIPVMPGWRWIHTPGHTPGHVSFFRDSDRTLIAGDAFCTARQESLFAVATQRPELHGPPAYFTTDWDAARDSVRRLAALNPAFIATAHGQPMSGEQTRSALHELARRFDEVARPEHGTYVEQPTRK
jgi:glyoxylase-like metal-dependent hydrolase (beta-lactamase superfamily II)